MNELTDIDIKPELVASHIRGLKQNKAAGQGERVAVLIFKEGVRGNCQTFSCYFFKLFKRRYGSHD